MCIWYFGVCVCVCVLYVGVCIWYFGVRVCVLYVGVCIWYLRVVIFSECLCLGSLCLEYTAQYMLWIKFS